MSSPPSQMKVLLMTSVMLFAACGGSTKGGRDGGGTGPDAACSSSAGCGDAGSGGVRDAQTSRAEAGTGAVIDGAAQDGPRDLSLADDGARAFDASGFDRAVDAPVVAESDARRGDAASAFDVRAGDAVSGRLDTADAAAAEPIEVVWRGLNTYQPPPAQEIRALVYHQGGLYAGGKFYTLGSLTKNGVARYEAGEWSLVGNGTVDGEVSALAVDTTGALYAGGKFKAVGTTPALAIAKWSANTWSALPAGPTEPVRTLTVDDRNVLYAAGDAYLDKADPSVRNYYANIWQWNGQAWASEAALIGECRSTTCSTFEDSSINNIVALPGQGVFYAGATTNFFSRAFDPNTTMINVQLFATDKSGALYVGGTMQEPLPPVDSGARVFPPIHNCIRKYMQNDGGTPEEVFLLKEGTPTISIKAMVADNRGNIYFGGSFEIQSGAKNVAVWDGKRIRALGKGVDGTVRALALNERGDQLFVAGAFFNAGGILTPMVAVADLDSNTPDGGP